MKYYENRFDVNMDYDRQKPTGVATWIQELAQSGEVETIQVFYLNDHEQILAIVGVNEKTKKAKAE